MDIREFIGRVCAGTAENLGPGYDVHVKEMQKNNGVVRRGIAIRKQAEKTAPVIYLDDLWEEHREGRSLEGIVNEILDIYAGRESLESLDVERFNDFEKVKGGICFRLFGRQNNEEFLKDMPHVEFLDMAVCFYYADMVHGEKKDNIVTVNNALMKRWDTDTDGLFRLAVENTPRMFAWECCPLDQVITKLMWCELGGKEEEFPCPSFEESPMQVLRNSKRSYGAACILYPKVLESIAEKEQCSFYIIPSSVHEVILVKDTGTKSLDELRRMIHEVNSGVLDPEEILTDSLYYYDAAEKRIKFA